MSIRYRDGWGLWHINGVAVDEQVVLRPDTQTIKQIDAEVNAEVKRVRIERYGWPRYIKETGARVLDIRTNDIDGTRESLMQANDGSHILVCACRSTGRVYGMRVPREISNCANAQRWLYGDKPGRCIGAS